MGRPRKIKSPKAFNNLVDAYVAKCTADEEPITWTGMALSLGFYGRKELDEYTAYDGFSHCVKRAKAIVAHAYECRLHGNNPTGAIFALKNMGWSDRQDVNVNSTVNIVSAEPMDLNEWREKHSLAAPAGPADRTH